MSEIKRMEIVEFWEAGYLQEVNRKFLHPLGLALEVVIGDDGTVTLGGIWDYRDDPEGISFAGVNLAPHAASLARIAEARKPARVAALGYWVQPPEAQP